MTKKGFTLIEIMVVVAIIIVLTTIVIAAGDAAKKKARDNQRKTDISLLQVKLEAYRGQNGVYPTPSTYPTFLSSFASPKDPSTKLDYKYIPLQLSADTCGASYYLYADNFESGNNNHVDPAKLNDLTSCGGTLPTMPITDSKIYDVTSPL